MAKISFDNALGIHAQAMQLRGQRTALIANNLANADTPGFKARDIDFRATLRAVQKGESAANSAKIIRTTHVRHMSVGHASDGLAELQYRVPLQPSLDGNTVDEQLESTEFAKNAMDFAASFRFLNGKFKGLSKAISGE